MTAVDVPAELEDLEDCLRLLVAERDRLGSRILERAPTVSGWSAGEHLYHLCLSTDLALGNVAMLIRGRGARITFEGEPNDLARRVLAEGRYPRGQSEAPRMVRPPETLEPELLDLELSRLQDALARIEGEREAIAGARGRIPHQHLGALDAGEWLRFARLHARHHLGIVRDVAAAVAAVGR